MALWGQIGGWWTQCWNTEDGSLAIILLDTHSLSADAKMPVESFPVQDGDEQNGWAHVLSRVSGLAPRWRAVAPLCISALLQNYVRLSFRLVQRLLCYPADRIKRKKICFSVPLWTHQQMIGVGSWLLKFWSHRSTFQFFLPEQSHCFLPAVSL